MLVQSGISPVDDGVFGNNMKRKQPSHKVPCALWDGYESTVVIEVCSISQKEPRPAPQMNLRRENLHRQY